MSNRSTQVRIDLRGPCSATCVGITVSIPWQSWEPSSSSLQLVITSSDKTLFANRRLGNHRTSSYHSPVVPFQHHRTHAAPFHYPFVLVLPLPSPPSSSLSLSSRKPTSKSRLNLGCPAPPPRKPPSPGLGTRPSSNSSSPNRLVPLSSLGLLGPSPKREGSHRASMREGRDGREFVADWKGRGMYEE